MVKDKHSTLHARAVATCKKKNGRVSQKCEESPDCDKRRGIGYSWCIKKEVKKLCRISTNAGLRKCKETLGGKPSRLSQLDKDNWVYMRPYIESGGTTQVRCASSTGQGTKQQYRNMTCRPLKGKQSVKEVIAGPNLMGNRKFDNDFMFNRMVYYKDARTKNIVVYWKTGRYKDRETGQMHSFEPLFRQTAEQFKKTLQRYNSDLDLSGFQDRKKLSFL